MHSIQFEPLPGQLIPMESGFDYRVESFCAALNKTCILLAGKLDSAGAYDKKIYFVCSCGTGGNGRSTCLSSAHLLEKEVLK